MRMVRQQAAPSHRLILFLQQSSVEWASSLWLHVVQEVDPTFSRTVMVARCERSCRSLRCSVWVHNRARSPLPPPACQSDAASHACLPPPLTLRSKFDNRLKEFAERWEVDRYLAATGYLPPTVKPFFVALPKVRATCLLCPERPAAACLR